MAVVVDAAAGGHGATRRAEDDRARGEDEIDRAADDGFSALEDAWAAAEVNLLDPQRDPLVG